MKNDKMTKHTKDPLPSPTTDSISPRDIAIIAALLNPSACKSETRSERRSALCDALTLWQESVFLTEELGPNITLESVEAFCDSSKNRNSRLGNGLFRLLLEQSADLPEPTLTLGLRDRDQDTLRAFLAENANFEGKKPERKQWSQVRSVWNNFEKFFIAAANRHNEANANRIRNSEEQDRVLSERASSKGGQSVSTRPKRSDEVWEDWRTEIEAFRKEVKRYKDGKLTHHEIPEGMVRGLIRWKRDIRNQKGGLSAIQPRTREEVLGQLRSKKKNPKSTR